MLYMNNNIYSIPKICISILHILLMYIITAVSLLSLNETVVFSGLIIMILIRFSYYIFNNRCIVTHLEDGKEYASAPQLYGYTITKEKLNDSTYEEIIINTGLLLLINKIIIMLCIKYYYKYLPASFKKLLYKYIYNEHKF